MKYMLLVYLDEHALSETERADCYTKSDPARIFDLQDALGEGSPYHREHGIYLDPVSPKLPTLPDGWEQRLIRLLQGDLVASFLEPNDAAVSKLARGEPPGKCMPDVADHAPMVARGLRGARRPAGHADHPVFHDPVRGTPD